MIDLAGDFYQVFSTIWVIHHLLWAVFVYIAMPSPHVLYMRKRGRKWRAEFIHMIVSLIWPVYLAVYLWHASRKQKD